MLIFTTIDLVRYFKHDNHELRICNLTCFKEGMKRLPLLPPIGGDYLSRDFDIEYAKFILSDYDAFMSVATIVSGLVSGEDIVILVTFDDDGPRDAYMESLMKFILCRYGYPSYIVRDLEDVMYVKSNAQSTFTVEGITNADNDIQALTNLMMNKEGYFNFIERMENSNEYKRSTYLH